MLLEVVDSDHSTGLLNIQSVLVDSTRPTGVLIGLTDLENVVEAIEGDLNDLVVHHGQEIAEGLDASLGNEVPDDRGFLQSTRGSIGDGPARLLPGLEVGILEDVDERRNDVGINDSLDLRRGSGGDVGDGPAGLLANAVLGRREEGQESRESTGSNDNLRLEVIASNDISHGSECRGLNRSRRMHQEVDEAPADAGLNNSLDLIVGPVREVGNRPACVNEDLVIERVDQLGEDGESGGDLKAGVRNAIDATRGRSSHQLPVGLRGLAPAEIAQSPGGVAEHADLVVFAEKGQQGTESTLLENVVPALRAVTSDVAQSPDSLFPDIEDWGREQLDKFGDSLGADNDLSVLSGARGDVGERPRGLELWHQTS